MQTLESYSNKHVQITRSNKNIQSLKTRKGMQFINPGTASHAPFLLLHNSPSYHFMSEPLIHDPLPPTRAKAHKVLFLCTSRLTLLSPCCFSLLSSPMLSLFYSLPLTFPFLLRLSPLPFCILSFHCSLPIF